MASLIVRNLDEALKTRLRVRAAYHGRSMEEEVRRILRAALAEDPMDLPVPELETSAKPRPRPRPMPAAEVYSDRDLPPTPPTRFFEAEALGEPHIENVPPEEAHFEEARFEADQLGVRDAAQQPVESPSILNSPHLTLPLRTPSAEAVSEGLRRRLTSLLTAYEGMVAREQSGR